MNKVILMGRLTRAPELRFSTNGNNTAVCRFSIAVDRRFQRPGEERQADFIPIVAFGKTGEFCNKHFSKGTRIAVVGSVQTRSWQDDGGFKHFATDIIAEEVHFADSKADSKKDNEQRGDAYEEYGYYPLDDDNPFD